MRLNENGRSRQDRIVVVLVLVLVFLFPFLLLFLLFLGVGRDKQGGNAKAIPIGFVVVVYQNPRNTMNIPIQNVCETRDILSLLVFLPTPTIVQTW